MIPDKTVHDKRIVFSSDIEIVLRLDTINFNNIAHIAAAIKKQTSRRKYSYIYFVTISIVRRIKYLSYIYSLL